jgi:CMP-N-acetylneuraminic acid synthetase
MKQKTKKILAIIPARGGSKDVPRKNVRLLNEKPLIVHTIEGALKSKFLDKIYVSTEDKEIAEISQKAGVDVIDRPVELAADHSLTLDAIRHAADFLKGQGYLPDVIVILQPTSPLRSAETIDSAIKIFLKNFNTYDSLVPLYPIEGKIGKIKNEIYKPEYALGLGRQKVERMYRECGTIFLLKTDLVMKKKDFGEKIYPFIIEDEREAHDIDTINDFIEAECFLGCQKRKKI